MSFSYVMHQQQHELKIWHECKHHYLHTHTQTHYALVFGSKRPLVPFVSDGRMCLMLYAISFKMNDSFFFFLPIWKSYIYQITIDISSICDCLREQIVYRFNSKFILKSLSWDDWLDSTKTLHVTIFFFVDIFALFCKSFCNMWSQFSRNLTLHMTFQNMPHNLHTTDVKYIQYK